MTEPSNIPSPFDKAGKADLVIETCDGAHLYVIKLFLVYASPFFEHLFADSFEDGEKYNDLPLYRVPEKTHTMITLLHLCYPAYLAKNKIAHEHIDGELMKALDKYLMEGVFAYMKEIIEDEDMVKNNPLKIYAIARNLGWDDLTRRAAREALKYGILTAEPIPELKLISGHDYHLLIRYFSACSTAVTRFLRPAVLNNGTRIVARNTIPEHIAGSVFACSPGNVYNKSCQHVGCDIDRRSGIHTVNTYRMHAWFVDYIREIFEDVSLRPGHGAVNPAKIEEILIKAETQCATQKPTAVRALLEWLNTEIDYIIDQVILES